MYLSHIATLQVFNGHLWRVATKLDGTDTEHFYGRTFRTLLESSGAISGNKKCHRLSAHHLCSLILLL